MDVSLLCCRNSKAHLGLFGFSARVSTSLLACPPHNLFAFHHCGSYIVLIFWDILISGVWHEFGTDEYNHYIPKEERLPGSRAAIVVHVHKVGSVRIISLNHSWITHLLLLPARPITDSAAILTKFRPTRSPSHVASPYHSINLQAIAHNCWNISTSWRSKMLKLPMGAPTLVSCTTGAGRIVRA